MTTASCPHCGGRAIDATTCPRSVPCPSCHADAGAPCRRPSGHRAAELHAERWRAAELADQGAGLLTLDGSPVLAGPPLEAVAAEPEVVALFDPGPAPMRGQLGWDV